MKHRRTQSLLWLSGIAVLCSGCHREPGDFVTWEAEPRPYSPNPQSANAYDAYAIAAMDAEAKGGEALQRVSFYPEQRKDASTAVKDAVLKVVQASSKPCDFQFVPHKPFTAIPYQSGWRLIGRVLVWQTQDAVANNDFDHAISAVVAGTRFGFGLTGGGATDASLGFAIVDELRQTIAPALYKLTPAQLDRLANGMKGALDSKPALTKAIHNERENSLMMIQTLQSSFRSGDLKTFQTNLGPDVQEALRYLEQLSGNTVKAKAYFDVIDKATDEEYKSVEADVQIPASTRVLQHPKWDTSWKKLAKYIFGSARPLLDLNDASVARTRLLILYCEIIRQGMEHKGFPADLSAFTKELTVDPYSGTSFIYHSDHAQFSIYSVGANGQDDGGDTDSSFTKPDLRLEVTEQ